MKTMMSRKETKSEEKEIFLTTRVMQRKKHKVRRFLAVFLAAVMVCSLFGYNGGMTVQAASETEQTSGECGANGNNLTWTFDGSTLTIIGNGAMADYDYASSVPWYSYCNKITTVVIDGIDGGVTSIGNRAFYGCSGLESIKIPSSVTTIGNRAFYNCSGLKSISIPENVTSIGKDAFSGCSSLESIKIPSNVTTIEESTFDSCSGLKSISISENVTSIGKKAFNNCSSLESIKIPSSVTKIGEMTFSECRGLKNIEIPSNVTTIEESTFSGCSGLESISIPKNVTSIGKKVFSECSGLTTIKVDGDNEKYDSRDNCNAIIEKSSNTLIAGCKNTIIPTSVTTIGDSAFFCCRVLESINIPSSVTTIGMGAFGGCSGLKSISIPSSVTTIGNSAFYGCSGLESIEIPESVTTIENFAFSSCSGLTSIEIPESVTTIENFAFSSCSGLESISILGNVTTIETGVFSNCSSLESINIPSSVTTIGMGAFGGCRGLESISIPSSVTTIGDYAFDKCTNLTIVNYSTCEVTGGKCIRNYINYDLNEGDWSASASALKNGTSEKCFYEKGKGNSDLASATDVIAPSRKGFAGWYRNKEFTGEKVTSISDKETKSITLYAKWLPLPNIKFVDGKSEENLNSTYTGAAVSYSTTKDELFTWGGDGTSAFTYYLSDGNTKTGTEGDQVSGATSEGGAPVNAGEYIVKVTVEEKGEYCEETSEGFSFTIVPANISGADVSLSPSSFYYTGKTIKCQPSVTCNGKTLTLNKDYTISYQNNVTVHDADGADAPTYTITGTGNYTGTKTGTFEIKYYGGEVTPTFNDASYDADKWYPSNVKIKANGYLISDSLSGNYVEKYTVNKSDTNTVTLYFKTNDTEGYITSGKTYTVKIDSTAPSFEGSDNGITITNHSSWWQKLLTAVSFGAYKSQEVTIKAADTESGVRTYYYYLDSNPGTAPLTADGLDKLDSSKWTEAPSGNFQMNSDGKYIVYAYAVDNMGNKSAYICSDGIVIDNTAPTAVVTVPDDTKKDVTATLHITSNEAGNVEYLITKTKNTSIDYATLKDDSNKVTCSITDAQAGTGEGKGVDCALTDLTAVTTYYVYAFVTDAAGNTSELASASFKTAKTTPVVDTPTVTGFTYDPGKTLNDVSIITGTNSVEGSWNWKTPSTVPTVNNNGYTAVFTPNDTDNYNTVEKTVTVAVTKATPIVDVLPTALAITYGQTLSDSVLSNGTAKYSDSDDTEVTGSYAWTTKTTKPAVADSEKTEYDVTFTPNDSVNYNSFTVKVKLTVNKAENAPDMPAATMTPEYLIKTVGAVTLPSNWEWNTEDATKELVVGKAMTAKACYVGEDKANYENNEVEVEITRAACTHKGETEIRNAKSATCTEDGYTGDTYCKDCGALVKKGEVIKATGHNYQNPVFVWSEDGKSCKVTYTCTNDATHKVTYDATITSKVKTPATCNVKGTTTYTATYGTDTDTKDVQDIALDASNHKGETEIRNAKSATCTEDGYTGDTYCKDCGKVLEKGKVIKATGHKWGEWKVTTKATYDAEGVETRVCSVCGEKETRAIAKLTKPADNQTAAKGKTYTVGSMKYKVTTVAGNKTGTVTYTGTTKSKKITSLTIGKTVKIGGKTYKVTAISDKAFKNNKNLKKVTIGANVTSIGKEAFAGCKAIKTITIQSKNLKKIGKNAIKGINKKAIIKVPSSKVKTYKKLFKSSTGFTKSMKIKK